MESLWTLEPETIFLNHGSFGACPRAVLEEQTALRARMERQPVRFFARELEALQDQARDALAAFLNADSEGLAFVHNATEGVNTVLRSLRLSPGDELLTTDHAYNACVAALDHTARGAGARLVVAPVPFPLSSAEQITQAVLGAVTARTRLVLLDHVTSPTGLIFPVAELVRALAERGIDTLVDGAHAPGMVPVDLRGLAAAYYTGNCHKWLCAPKGAAFLHVRADRRAGLHPLSLSHGYNSPRTDRSRFRLEFDWTGTADPTPHLLIPAALRFLTNLVPGGVAAVSQRNHRLVLVGRALLCEALGVPEPAPAALLGSMATVLLPPLIDPPRVEHPPAAPVDPLQDHLLYHCGIEVPVVYWPLGHAAARRGLRISAQLYNHPAHYQQLAAALAALRPVP